MGDRIAAISGERKPVTIENITPRRLIIKLLIYFVVLISLNSAALIFDSDVLQYLPVGGADALERMSSEVEISTLETALSGMDTDGGKEAAALTTADLRRAMLFLSTTLLATTLIMIPIAWTYTATSFDSGPSKVFVRALIVLPICATTVVLLIQDSLALAFGLAALVAAVRFRVALAEAIDGIYIFAAICVGLAAGIGYLGVAAIMAMFFCLINALLWQIDYGRNPVDDTRQLAKKAKLNKPIG